MKKIDQIKALDNVGLAQLLLGNHCKVCYQWDEANGCKLGDPTGAECLVEMTKGLAQEVNPFPELVPGDKLVTPAGYTFRSYIYVGHKMVCREDNLRTLNSIQNDVIRIERLTDNKKFEVIWIK